MRSRQLAANRTPPHPSRLPSPGVGRLGAIVTAEIMATDRHHAERIIILSAAAFLPTIAMIPIGGYYLWRDGYLLHFALAALASSAVVYMLQWTLLRRAVTPDLVTAQNSTEATALPNAIERLAATADVERLTSTEGVLGLAQETLALVARHLHPSRTDAVWQFTVPQALSIAEQVSRRLQIEIVSKIPFGDKLTIAQVINLYRFRAAFTVAERLYDMWRVVRLVNPATAATHEMRERLSKAAVSWGRDQVMRRLTRIFIEQVARAGMDLYTGKLSPLTQEE